MRVLVVGMVAALLQSAAAADAAPPAAHGRLPVGFERGVDSERQEAVLKALGGRAAQRFGAIRGGRLVLVRPRSGQAAEALRKRLRKAIRSKVDKPVAFKDKVVSEGRLNAQKALGAVGSLVD